MTKNMMAVIYDAFKTGFTLKEHEFSNVLCDFSVHCSLCQSLKKKISASELAQSGFMTRMRIITSPWQSLFSASTGQLESKESLK